MDAASANSHLQVIRTLMERAALYRRALAPVMTLLGVFGVAAGIAGYILQIQTFYAFVGYWFGVSIVSLAGAYFLIRKQAISAGEPFWSPPARRVTQALLPAFISGVVLTFLLRPTVAENARHVWDVVVLWSALHGCALHAAGFFTPRGLRWLGWGFIGAAAALLALLSFVTLEAVYAHAGMGVLFGLLQLAYGAYLNLTENRSEAA